MTPPPEGLRADAQQNRSRILDVARKALTADPEASLNSIAKMAGVGAGTLYRHFPNRGALVLEIYRQEIHQMVDLAPALLARLAIAHLHLGIAILVACDSPLEAQRAKCRRLGDEVTRGGAGLRSGWPRQEHTENQKRCRYPRSPTHRKPLNT